MADLLTSFTYHVKWWGSPLTRLSSVIALLLTLVRPTLGQRYVYWYMAWLGRRNIVGVK